MIPGLYYFFECPHCGYQLKKGSFASANTFGAKLYSDLKRLAPDCTEYPIISRCKNCYQIFWLMDSNLITESDDDDLWLIKNKKKVEDAEFLDVYDYFEALEMKLSNNIEDEVYLRNNILWCFNDRIRDAEVYSDSKADMIIWRQNLNRLIEILDYTNIDQRILMAELYRNLGNFEKCIALIESIEPEDYAWLKEKYINECSKKNKMVFLLY
ncbi:MAG: hypothetical protein HXX18_09525 [Bacteroidetes bacterium]|nr:hypothetical protein [Bacteroidota bacterium]